MSRSGYYCNHCKKDHEDRMVICFACDETFHAKCLGLNGNLADKITHERGIHFYCERHRSISVSDLLKKLSKLQEFHRKFSLLVGEYDDVLNADFSSINQSLRREHPVISLVEELPRKSTRIAAKNIPNYSPNTESNKKSTSRNMTLSIPDTPIAPETPVAQAEVPAEPLLTSTSDILALQAHQHVDDQDDILVAAAPEKAVFVSRLQSDTTVEAVRNYIGKRYNVSNITGFHIHKLRSDPSSSFSSFKIFVGHCENLFLTLTNEQFWPGNVIAREFFRRRKRHNVDIQE